MNKTIKILFAFVTCVLALCACSGEDMFDKGENKSKGNMTFTASFSNDEGMDTRTALDGLNVVWSAGDEISVISDGDFNTNSKFTLASEAGKTNASFTGTCAKGSNYYAVFPYHKDNEYYLDGLLIKCDCREQTSVKGSFDPSVSMLAKTTGVDVNATSVSLNFKNLFSFVKVTTDYKCKSITLTSKNGSKYLSSSEQYIMFDEDGNPYVKSYYENSNSVTLKGKDDAIIEAGTYYIAVYPGTLDEGFDLTFTAINGTDTYTKSTTKSVTLKRNTVLNLGNITLRGTSLETLEGEGTEANPYKIYDMDDLITMQRWVNSGSKMDKEYELENDIDGEDRDLTPIGTASKPFSGHFRGNGHTLRNIHLGQSPLIYGIQDNTHDGFKPLYYTYVSGLFGFINDAEIENLTISKFTMYENRYLPSDHSEFANEHTMVKSLLVGVARGYSESSSLIKNITIDADQTLKLDDAPEEKPLVIYGGIVGASLCNLWIEGCTNYCNVAGTTYRSAFYGSILGFALGGQEFSDELEYGSFVSINKCRNFGNMTMGMVSNIQYHSCFMGGILGHALNFNYDDDVAVQIVNCVNFGNLSAWKSAAAQDNAIGGIAGTMNTDGLSDKDIAISNCINNGTINSTCYGGGIFGRGSADGDVYPSSGKGDIMIQYCATTNAITASDRTDGNDFIGYYKDKAYYNNVKVFSKTAAESTVTATECRDFMNQKLQEAGAIETGLIYSWKLYDKDNTKLDLDF